MNRAWNRLLSAAILTGITDGLFSGILSVAFYHSTVTRLFQGVASTLVGASAFDRGINTAAIGVLMHFGVAFGWSAVFLLLLTRVTSIARLVRTRSGTIAVAALYGPFIWLVMSLIVIPLLLHRPPTINLRWWVQLVGHFPFVGVPIVATLATLARSNARAGRDE